MTSPPAPAKLDDLIAIHREIAAMVCAGIPLELGLRTFSGGLQNQLGRMADRIADRLSEGRSLPQAIELEGAPESTVYAAVMSAGLESGNLPEALESIATSAEVIRETRSHLVQAMIYPAIIVVLAYVLFAAFVWFIGPLYVNTARDFGFGKDIVFEILDRIHSTEYIWVWLVPLILLLTVIVAKRRFRTSLFSPLFLTRTLARAQFADLLMIQLNHGLPIGTAFRRAADGSGDVTLRQSADVVCQKVEQGVPFHEAITRANGLSPLMSWMLATGARQGTLIKSLALVRDSCRRSAVRRAHFLKVWLPVAMTFLVGSTVVLTYGLLNFIPLRAFWNGLMHE